MWGHMNARMLGESYPQFFKRADGCRIWDVDGNEYVDLMCSWGPIVLGHHHAIVDQAFAAQVERGDTMNGPAEVMVELAELLVSTIAHADWAMFQKNGTNATTACLTIARAGTGRRKVLVARGSYHGAVPWCSPSVAGVDDGRPRPSPLFRLQRYAEPRECRRSGARRSCGYHRHGLSS
jgi:glutamate-1-semialdehyde 2,1-aminomutase